MDARCAEAAGVRFAAHRAGYAGQPSDLLPQVTGFDHYDAFTPWLLGHLSNVPTSSPENCHA
jgi:phosphoglycolate phosphatase